MAKFIPPSSENAGYFLTRDERDEIVASGEPLVVVDVERKTDVFKGRSREVFKVTFDVDGEERGWSFTVGSSDGSETSRDRFLAALEDYLNSDDAEVTKLVVGKAGSFYTLDTAE